MAEKIHRIRAVPVLPRRAKDAYKTQFGRVLIVGGCRGMIGAPALAANAALRGGAGLATVAVPAVIQLTVAGLCPCATSIPLACDEAGGLTRAAIRQFRDAAGAADVIALGPGLAVSGMNLQLVQSALEQEKPLVLDAGGLMNLVKIEGWPALRRCPLILTPHPGEFSHLTGEPSRHVQADRLNAAAGAARRWQGMTRLSLVCVLKGAGTVVTDGRRAYVNATGNPGLATGGSGDVLTGLAAAMLGQRLPPFEAACLAAWVHGRAGDLAAKKLGQASMIAGDLLDYLPAAMIAAAKR